jgi:hypothetical protein
MDNNTKLMYNEALDAAYMDKIKSLYASCFTAAIEDLYGALRAFETGADAAEKLLLRLKK